ncbi:MAG: Ppx/GppA family phosphatase [Alphaproteobacteria bacterium]|nr:Ppx/GppA family phosphatase [Alphaproteobacteria bacterium]
MAVGAFERAFGTRAEEVRAAVIDVGSNSIRLVVYDHLGRAPWPLFNERVICGIGRDVARTGRLNPEGVDRALSSLPRFARIARAMGVAGLDVLATAATREAVDGPAFLAEVARICGVPVRQLDGGEEARLAAHGVIMGIPDARGIVGDLGGGSLELAAVDGGRALDHTTLPLGPLRLLAADGANRRQMQEAIDATLADVDWLDAWRGAGFYPVGGAWRAFARVHMAQTAYPLRVIHQYAVSGRVAADFAKLVSRLGKGTLAAMGEVPAARLATLPVAALVLRRVVKRLRPAHVTFSALGLREGSLFERLDPDERVADPLVLACTALADRESRFGNRGDVLFDWTAALFAGETPSQSRLRHAACLLADIGWHEHPDYRAEQVYLRILRLPFTAIDHADRARLALALYARYGGPPGVVVLASGQPFADENDLRRLATVGLALRLAETLAAGMPDLLGSTRLRVAGSTLRLELTPEVAVLDGEVARARFDALAKHLGLAGAVVVG